MSNKGPQMAYLASKETKLCRLAREKVRRQLRSCPNYTWLGSSTHQINNEKRFTSTTWAIPKKDSSWMGHFRSLSSLAPLRTPITSPELPYRMITLPTPVHTL